jgi:hypothetical protein
LYDPSALNGIGDWVNVPKADGQREDIAYSPMKAWYMERPEEQAWNSVIYYEK